MNRIRRPNQLIKIRIGIGIGIGINQEVLKLSFNYLFLIIFNHMNEGLMPTYTGHPIPFHRAQSYNSSNHIHSCSGYLNLIGDYM